VTMHGSSRERGRLWLVMLAALGAALVSLLALLQWDTPVRAEEDGQGEIQPQIVGGQPVPDGKYPFMAVLDIGDAAGGSYLCGGTLIDPDSVLTAAHCLEGATDVNLAVGRTVLSQQNQGQVRSATDWFIPSGYDGSRDDRYDAAVLTLDRPVNGITPIKLATARQDGLERPRRNLTVAGWGTTSEGGNTSDRMREVSVPVVSDARAQDAYGPRWYFPKVMVAAGARGQDSCQGDSGGPLFNPGDTRTQVGIVSFGAGCARAGFPGVYTEVNNTAVRSFIVDAAQR
jgi:secreted trypsin-like serine protease